MLRRLSMQLLLLLALLLSTLLWRHIQRIVILFGGAATRCRGGIAIAAAARAAAVRRAGHIRLVGGGSGRGGCGLLPAFHLVLAIVGAVCAIAPFAVQFGNVYESHEEAEER